MANPTVKTGIAQQANLAFALWVSPDVVGGSGAWDAKNSVRAPAWGTLNSVALGTSGKNGLASTAANCGVQLGPSNNHTGTPYDFTGVNWTIIALLRPLSSGTPIIYQNQEAWSPNYGILLQHSGTFAEGRFRGNSTGVAASSSSGVAVVNQAMTLAIACDATSLKLYKNGTQIATQAHSQTSQVYGSSDRIAGLFNYAQAKGASAVPLEIYAVIGWNSSLTAAELQTFGTTESALLAGDFYTAAFDFGGGAVTHDATGSLSASASTLSASAARTGAAVTHSATASLVAGSATLSASAARSGSAVTHSATAALTASAATLSASASHAASGSFVSDIMINNTGTVQSSVSITWEWNQGSIGSAKTSTVYGTGTTTSGGTYTATGLPSGSGFLLATTADGSVYYQPGTVA